MRGKASEDSETLRQGTHYRMAMIERTEVERIRTARAQWISKSSAAERVGVADSVLQNLERAGLLESDPRWRSTILKSGPVSTVALEMLVPKLEGTLTPDPTVTDTLAFNAKSLTTGAWEKRTRCHCQRTVQVSTVRRAVRSSSSPRVKCIATLERPHCRRRLHFLS